MQNENKEWTLENIMKDERYGKAEINRTYEYWLINYNQTIFIIIVAYTFTQYEEDFFSSAFICFHNKNVSAVQC